MLRCDLETEEEVIREVLEEFSTKLVTSKFDKVMIAKIMRNGIIAYMKALSRYKKNKRDLNLPAEVGMHLRRLEKVVNKSEWYRKRRKSRMIMKMI